MTTVADPTVFWGRELARLVAGIMRASDFDFALSASDGRKTRASKLGSYALQMEVLATS